MAITKTLYGSLNGKDVNAYIIENKNGTRAHLIEKGATLDKFFIRWYNYKHKKTYDTEKRQVNILRASGLWWKFRKIFCVIWAVEGGVKCTDG